MKYRPEIDGLRALAVAPVILFHAGFGMFSGGYVGVDVFFVISGYLISLIVISEVRDGSFSLIAFYERRARRILPALFALVAFITPAAWFLMMPHQLKDFAESVLAVSLFSANVLFWLESGYFELASELKPLLHTWSLAVEEQFYLLFPLAVLVFHRLAKHSLAWLFVIIFIGSFSLAQTISHSAPDANFYLPFTRAWELLAGSLAALYVLGNNRPNSAYGGYFSVAGLLLIMLSILLLDRETPFPSVYALPTILGTLLVILFANGSNFAGKILSLPACVFIGKISYSLYLWHFPVFAFARIALNSEPPPLLYAALIALVIPISYLSYRYVETPFRGRTRISKQVVAACSVLGVLIFSGMGLYGHRTNGFAEIKFANLQEPGRSMLVDVEKERRLRRSVWTPLLTEASRPFDPDQQNTALILGDSVAEDLYVALSIDRDSFPGWSFRFLRLDDACMQYLSKRPPLRSVCHTETTDLLASGLSHAASHILVTATWQQHTVTNIQDVIQFFTQPDRRLLVLGSANFNDIASLTYQIARKDIARQDWGSYFAANKRTDWDRQNERLESIVARTDATYLSKYEVFCTVSAAGESCDLIGQNNQPLIYDTGHLTSAGASFMNQRIRELNWLAP